jgi:hypothetical protein
VGELAAVVDTENAAIWAREALPAKNSLRATDAKLVEAAFEERIAAFVGDTATDKPPTVKTAGIKTDGIATAAVEPLRSETDEPAKAATVSATDTGAGSDRPQRIDKSVLAMPEPRRYRNKDHLRFVASKPCLSCGRKPSDPHHLRFVQPRALGRKASDEFVVPLCRIHHRLVHRVGNEAAWWRDAGIDPIKAAGRLWKRTRRVEAKSNPADASNAPAQGSPSRGQDIPTATTA